MSYYQAIEYNDCNRNLLKKSFFNQIWPGIAIIVRRYKLIHKCLLSKSIFLILIWSFMMNLLYSLPHNKFLGHLEHFIKPVFIHITLTLMYCLGPIAGFIADNKFGPYKTVISSICIMIFVLTLSIVLLYVVIFHQFSSSVMFTMNIIGGLLTLTMIVTYVVYYSNIIQLGMDQLHDSPLDYQSLFIHWYTWIKYLTFLLGEIGSCLTDFFGDYVFVSSLVFIAVTISITTVVVCCKQIWFFIDRARVSPYKLVYQVTKFACRHKAPVRRSAFTYCEDERPSRLDLGMRKYGGPFTTEQVENVKAFYGVVKILLVTGPLYMLENTVDTGKFGIYGNSLCYNETKHYNLTRDYSALMKFFLLDHGSLILLLIIFVIPFHLIILRPVFLYCIPGMLKRIGLGIFFMIISLIITFLIDGLFDLQPVEVSICRLYNEFNSPNTIGWKSLRSTLQVFQHFFTSLSTMLFYIALYEFICSQSPQSMKGLLIGMSYSLKGISQLIASMLTSKLLHIKNSHISLCGVYYYPVNIAIGTLTLLAFIGVARKYRYRKRDDICHVYQFAEDYYSKAQNERFYDYSGSLEDSGSHDNLT